MESPTPLFYDGMVLYRTRTVSIVSHLATEDWGDVAGETGNEAAANNSLHKEAHTHTDSR